MSAKIFSATLHALDAKIVEVEADISSGLPGTTIVGLADKAIRESRERVRACLKSSKEFVYPLKRISINLAPANLYKYGSQFDLAIAMAILLASGQVIFDPKEVLFLGELALDGVIRPVNGSLAMALAARDFGLKKIFLPAQNLAEARMVNDVEFVCCSSLTEVVKVLQGGSIPVQPPSMIDYVREESVNFSEISGQGSAKRALEVAASGGHNCLFIGPPGAGKTLLAKSIVSILPDPEPEQRLEIVKIHSVSGGVLENKIAAIPFRSPHHTVSLQAFIGGGMVPRPGEISLAHNGVLFLDEFPEFPRYIIESLRQPLENGSVAVSRIQSNYIFPANFILLTAQNPCPCGRFEEDGQNCICTPSQIQKYRSKISGPILDRIDLQVYVPKVDLRQVDQIESESSEIVKARVLLARKMQRKRFGSSKLNSRMSRAEIKKYCQLDSSDRELIYEAEHRFEFSARAYFRVLRVARTIADLRQSAKISRQDLAESLNYRVLENYR